MRVFLASLAVLGLVGLSACSSKFKTYDGPPVTHVYVFKQQRMLVAMSGARPIGTWAVDLGFAPEGDKAREGDGRTPEGRYYINRKNPDSAFHLSLGISYPDNSDRRAAREAGDAPGGDIFIHGGPTRASDVGKPDWTAGCIAVSDDEIEDIYAMIRVGTPIDILP